MPPPYFTQREVRFTQRDTDRQLELQFFKDPRERPLQNTRRTKSNSGLKWALNRSVLGGELAWSAASLVASFAMLARAENSVKAAGILVIVSFHELGHLGMARWLKVPAKLPIFLGKLGAFVQIESAFATPVEEAWIGIGGPLAGVAATCLVHWLAKRYESEDLLEVAMLCYAVHLFNMIPAGVLDGGRIAALLGRWLWVPGCILLYLLTYIFANLDLYACILLPLLLIPATFRAWQVLSGKGKTPQRLRIPYKRAHYCGVLLITVAILVTCLIGVFHSGDSFFKSERLKLTPANSEGVE